jgi:NADP-dependent 3-hydroxy acid dehydrogenase YdfG
MQSQYSPEEQRKRIAQIKMLRAEDIAACGLYTITPPKRCDVVELQIRPHLQAI